MSNVRDGSSSNTGGAVRVNGGSLHVENLEVVDCGIGIAAQNGAVVSAKNYSFENTGVAVAQDKSSKVKLGADHHVEQKQRSKPILKNYKSGYRFPDDESNCA